MAKEKLSRQDWVAKRRAEIEDERISVNDYGVGRISRGRIAPLCFVVVVSVSLSLSYLSEFRGTQRMVKARVMASWDPHEGRRSTNSSTSSFVQVRDTKTKTSPASQPHNNTSSFNQPQELPNISYSHLDHGAFLHLGKTGGSTLSLLLRNGCHSFVKKPCPDRFKLVDSPNETIASRKISHYYHVPDFPKLPKDPTHPFYIITLRDPFYRTRSSFVYVHPANIGPSGQRFNPWRPIMRKYYNNSLEALTKCFPTLEDFVQNLGDGDQVNNFSYPERLSYPQEMHQENCQNFARAAMSQKVPALNHIHYNAHHVYNAITQHLQKPNTVLFATRQEHLMDDWVNINKLLGQSTPIHIPASKTRDISKTVLPVPNELSQAGSIELCKALRQEYKDYLSFLTLAVNLGPKDVEEAKALGRKNCPQLEFL